MVALVAVVAALAGLGGQAAASPAAARVDERGRSGQQVRVVDLGVGIGFGAEATHVTDSGHVFGSTYVVEGGTERRAFRWRAGVMTELGRPDQVSTVNAVNERGDAVAQVSTLGVGGPPQAVLWRRDGTVVDLSSDGLSRALGLDRRGTVVGETQLVPGGSRHAAIWRTGELTVLDDLGAPASSATGINDRGQVIGSLRREGDDLPTRPFRWHHGRMTVFENPEPPQVADLASAADINRRGEVLVWSGDRLSPFSIWYLWDGQRTTRLPVPLLTGHLTDRGEVVGTLNTQLAPGDPLLPRALRITDGAVTYLGTLGHTSTAVASNRRGQVVGASRPSEAVEHAVLFDDGAVVDLGTLGGDSSAAVDIDRRGRIVGHAEDSAGVRHAVMWRVGW